MREILFKAKRVNNGEWVVGQYVNTCYPGKDKETGHFIVVYPNKYHEIYTSTLCQFTGLCDKNGNKIWENDICQYDDMDICAVRYGEYDNNTEHRHIGFYTDWQKYKDLYRKDLGFWVEDRELEVIGNIFDNPELLQEERK